MLAYIPYMDPMGIQPLIFVNHQKKTGSPFVQNVQRPGAAHFPPEGRPLLDRIGYL